MGAELFYLFGRENPDVIVLRWLRARKWHVPHAVQFMMDTLKWRHEWGLQRLMGKGESDLIKEECASEHLSEHHKIEIEPHFDLLIDHANQIRARLDTLSVDRTKQ
ncbi:unnamed protein product [Rotaria sp. Silwood1]|nr:unnamed protein product [Rotaria sp. Silwood1]